MKGKKVFLKYDLNICNVLTLNWGLGRYLHQLLESTGTYETFVHAQYATP